jgi:hypothetical protein
MGSSEGVGVGVSLSLRYPESLVGAIVLPKKQISLDNVQ